MKCRFCPCRVENNNAKDGYQPDGCFSGDDYLDDYCYEDKDGDSCCAKTKDEIENDIEDHQEYKRYDEEALTEEKGGKGFEIEHREPTSRKCVDYCICKEKCSFYKSLYRETETGSVE